MPCNELTLYILADSPLTITTCSHNVGYGIALAIYQAASAMRRIMQSIWIIDPVYWYVLVVTDSNPERNIMKIIPSTIFAALALASLSAQAAQPIINLSIGGEISPGVYGQVQFGNAPPPPVFYPEPKIIVEQPAGRRQEPIYLHVPPAHARNWARYCRRYNACNRPVYFVKSREYEPGYREHMDRGRHEERHRDEHREDEHRRDEGHRDERGGEGDRGR